MELIIGILLGVGFSFFGVWATEYIRDKRKKNKLINALYLEIIYNMLMAGVNYKLTKDRKQKKKVFLAFHTIAFENFKQGILLDEDKHEELLINLFQGYALIDIFNGKRIEIEKEFTSEDKEIFSEITKYLKYAHDEIGSKVKSVKL
jgi:hypothetical protein